MLLWINGPFGVGKTATAYELQRRLPGSIVCDPEHLGFGLHRMIPPALRTDYQDLPVWRSGVREVLGLVARNHGGPVIVPMTLIDSRYFTQIIGGLRDDGHEVRHFALLAERATVLRRLNRRGFGFGLKRERWAVGKLDECLIRLREREFAHHVATDQQTVPQVADTIARIAELPDIPDTGGRLRASLRRYTTTLRHVRFDLCRFESAARRLHTPTAWAAAKYRVTFADLEEAIGMASLDTTYFAGNGTINVGPHGAINHLDLDNLEVPRSRLRRDDDAIRVVGCRTGQLLVWIGRAAERRSRGKRKNMTSSCIYVRCNVPRKP